MRIKFDKDRTLFVDVRGPDGGPVVLFAHSLGLSHAVWDGVLPHLPDGLRTVAVDMRGHGASDVPEPPYGMGSLVKDVEQVCAALKIKDAVMVGNSIGGMIAQGLAAKRLDLVRGLVLSNTAPKIGTRPHWDKRIAAIEAGGMEAITEDVLGLWFSRKFRDSGADAPWRKALLACPAKGYAGCSAAIAGTDFYSTTGALRLPTLVVAGTEDRSTPPDLVRELAELIPGSEFTLMRGSGHVPAADSPKDFAAHLTAFLTRIGHVP